MIKMPHPTVPPIQQTQRQDPVPVGAPTALALPNSGAMVPWAPQGLGDFLFRNSKTQFFGAVLRVVGDAGDSQILVDVDQEGLAIGEMLQDLRKMMGNPRDIQRWLIRFPMNSWSFCQPELGESWS